MNFRTQGFRALSFIARHEALGRFRLAILFLLIVAATASLISSWSRRAPSSKETTTLQGAAAIEQLKHDGQFDSLQAAMNAARFSVSRVGHSPLGGAAWHAPNAAAGYDAYVNEAGVYLMLNNAGDGKAKENSLSLRLRGLGYGDALSAVGEGRVSGDGQSIAIEHNDGRNKVREWFINGAGGLEHGFTLDQPPQFAMVAMAATPLRLALQISEGWRASAGADGKRVTLRNDAGQAVDYGQLTVRDDDGRDIAARLIVANEQVVIEVEDCDARYPLTIDPLFTLQKQLLANDGADFDLFGYAVALDGNTAMIGAPYDEVTHTDQGSVYVFVRSGTTWALQQKLFANDGQPGDKFGSAVAISGNTALIGAPESDEGTNTEIGSAYVFVRNGTMWTFQQKLGATGGFAGALFGAAVALDGNTALVGAYQQTITPSFDTMGAAYIFVRNGTQWTQQQRLLSNDAQDGDSFGISVALDGDTALIGAPLVTITAPGQGAAYIFTRSGTVWTQQPRLNLGSATAQGGAHFGAAVALSGEDAAIGIPLHGNNDRGAVVRARRDLAGWTLVQLFEAPNPTTGAHFGTSLAMDGGLLVVGASLGLSVAGVDQRTAYVYSTVNASFIRQFGVEVGNADDRFGYAVAVKGDTVLVGAYRADAAATDQGAAYVFALRDSQHAAQPKLLANDGAADDAFGFAVTISGDLLAVGVQDAKIGTNIFQGAVYVFTRNGAGWTFQGKITAPDGAAEDSFGNAVALSGTTLAIGAYGADIGGNANQGAVYVFIRNGATWVMQKKLFAVGIDGLPGDFFGSAIALEGDTLAVSARGYGNSRGAAYVFTRTGTTWAQQGPKLLANDGAAGDRFGQAIALSGDTLVAGAAFAKIGTNTLQGAAYVFTRANATWAFQRKLTADDGVADDRFGTSVAVNNDTAAVGAPFHKVGTNDQQGAVYVFTRSGTIWVQQPKLTADNGGASDHFGWAVALSGDTLVAGAYRHNSLRGAAYVFTRLGSWRQQQQLTAGDGQPGDEFGKAVALSGDTIVVGAPEDSIGTNAGQGSAYTFAAPACPALTLNPAGLPNGTVGTAYNQPITVSGGRAGEIFPNMLSGGALPPGLEFEDGVFGTPTTPGTYHFTVTFRSSLSQCPAVRSYTLTILPPCPTITLNPAGASGGTVGTAYSQTLTASGGTAPYSFSILSGALPPGLNLSANGVLSGTPTAVGTHTFTVMATAANGCTGLQTYTINVACPTVTLNPVTLPNGATGTAYSQTLTANGGTSPHTFVISAGALPGGLTLFSNGTLTGTPVIAGAFNFTITATDANGCTGSRSYSVTISDIGGGGGTTGLQFYPLVHPVRLLETRAGQSGCFTPGAPIAGGTSRTQPARGLCDGLTIPANAAAITGNITTVQSGGGYLTLYPSNAAQPLVANTNYAANEIVNNVFTVGLGNDGAFKIFALNTTDVVVDVTGYYAPPATGGLYFHPLPKPIRLLETRAGFTGCFTPNAPLQGGTNTAQLGQTSCGGVIIPAGAQALVGNATTVGPQGGGYLTLYP
ncbi:MAG TPA: putative Ig domain-containing protein, partial [Blastocatellia bacterium]|nr:putative Ig domain-containing protein [Blastocatellia bacterium]